MIVGVIGGGQLGRMLALAGTPLGMHFRCLEPASDAPMARLAEHVAAEYDDEAALARFVAGLDVATFEFENVPSRAARFVAERVALFPPVPALHIAQDRIAEKTFFRQLRIPVPAFAQIDGPGDLRDALEWIGLPAVLKTRRLGYDGKGQWTLRGADDTVRALQALIDDPHPAGYVLEQHVPFDRELSIIAVRGRDGATAFYGPVRNVHQAGILRESRSVHDAPAATLCDYAARALTALDYVGVLAIEFFQQGGELFANEMAPRVHNSGHWTIEGAETSQFENHLRAIAGLPLGSTELVGSSAMFNLIGRLPDIDAVLRVPGAHLHLYDKAARPGRKLGHVTVVGRDAADLERRQARLHEALRGESPAPLARP